MRKDKFVRADRVLKLRKTLEDICSVKGLTSEEKDPEEFLNILLAETLKATPFLKVIKYFLSIFEGMKCNSIQYDLIDTFLFFLCC